MVDGMPEFVVQAARRGADGGLLYEDRTRIGELLLDRGFVLLPSDTSYSVATILFDASVRRSINTLLRRGNEPISFAFSSVAATRRWVAPNRQVERLLAQFCPGPITVVCRTPARGIPRQLLNDAIASENRTLGVRVPDSAVERDVAASTAYPITTVAVRRDDGVVTSRDAAVQVIAAGLAASSFTRWCLVEGSGAEAMGPRHSTVVEVTADGYRYQIVREGAIAASEIDELLARTHDPPPARASDIPKEDSR